MPRTKPMIANVMVELLMNDKLSQGYDTNTQPHGQLMWWAKYNQNQSFFFTHPWSMDWSERGDWEGKRNYTWKVGQLTLLVIALLGFNLIVIRHTLVRYLQNYCWMSWSLFIAVKTTPDFYSVLCLYSCDTQQVPFRYQRGKKVKKVQAWSLDSVKPSAMGFTRIGLTLRLTFHRPLFQ